MNAIDQIHEAAAYFHRENDRVPQSLILGRKEMEEIDEKEITIVKIGDDEVNWIAPIFPSAEESEVRFS